MLKTGADQILIIRVTIGLIIKKCDVTLKWRKHLESKTDSPEWCNIVKTGNMQKFDISTLFNQ